MSPHERNGDIRCIAIITAALTLLVLPPLAGASVPARWHAPAWWLRDALCVHQHEAAWNNDGVTWDGHPSPYHGGLQFLLSTWSSVGGVGDPAFASPREQLYRAWLVWKRDGGSWREWGTAGDCGLR